MKICFIMPFHIMEQRGGGAEVQAWLLAKELSRRNYEVYYIAQSVKKKQGREHRIEGVRIKWIKYKHRFRWMNSFEYYRALKEIKPELLVQRGSTSLTAVAGYYSKKYKKDFIWICTDNSSSSKWIFSRSYLSFFKRKFNVFKIGIFLVNAFILDVLRQWGMRQITFPFTQNGYQQSVLKKSYGLESYHMISGHESPKIILLPEERLKNRIVLWVGNLGTIKRPGKFIELARLGRGNGFRFVMIGGRNDDSYIRKIFHYKPNNLEWLGKLPYNETLYWFTRATFFMNTSISEGFPNTYIQSWLRGVPVFTLEADPDNVIQQNGLGYVSNRLDLILEKLKYLTREKDRYIEISKNVIEYANSHHSIKKMTDNFLKITLGL